jgi:hypothetical protein
VAGVETHLPAYLLARATRVLDAWDRLAPDARADVASRLAAAVEAATGRVGRELAELVATNAAAQRGTPLEVVRGGIREPTEVLAAAGVAPVARDEFEERSFPSDRYGLTPRTFADLGDDELGPLHLRWGFAKAQVLRASRPQPPQ